MNMMKKFRAAVLSFAYLSTVMAPAMADDTEIYLGGTGGGGGAPNVVLLLDTSGSMRFRIYDQYPAGHPNAGSNVPYSTSGCPGSGDCATNPDDSRGAHMQEALRRLLDSLNGDIRVGISRYNANGTGGRMIYPARSLDSPVGAAPGEVQERSYRVLTGVEDAHQMGSAGSGLVTNAALLPVGDVSDVNYSVSVQSTVYQRGTNTTSSDWFANQGVIPLGPYNTSNITNLGMRFADINIPQGATILSAELVLSHCNGCAAPRTNGPVNSDNGPVSLNVYLENTINANFYARTTSGQRVHDRSYNPAGAPSFNTTIPVGALTGGSQHGINVTNMLQNRVSQAGWNTSNDTITLRLEGTQNYNATSKNGRLISGSPFLRVDYRLNGERTYTGLKFSSIDIPKDAEILEAYLDFKAAATNSGSASWQFTLDPAVDATAFGTSAAANLDGTRWSGGSTFNWSPGNWTNGQTYTLSHTAVPGLLTALQAKVNQAGFCGGGSFAFRIRENGVFGATTQRIVSAYENAPLDAPTLRVKFRLPAEGTDTCMQASRVATVKNSSDDVSQSGSTQTLVGTDISLRSDRIAGLRFPNLSVPQGSVIRSATLKLKASNNASSIGTITIRGVAQPDTVEFSDTNKIGTLPTTATSVSWAPTAWSSGASYTSAEIKTIVQDIVNQAGWDKGNALVLRLNGSGTSSGVPRFFQVDSGASGAAVLSVQYEARDPEDAVRRVRQELIEVVNNLVFNGGTPLNGTYYETAKYMMGTAAEYGPASTYPDSAESQTAANVYISPLDGGECQSNNIIALTDGEPSGDQTTKRLGTVACNGSFDCMNKTAAFLKNTGKDLGGGEKGLVSTYTIGFGPDVSLPTNAAYQGLSTVAKVHGGGDFFAASDVDVLASNFETIFARIADTNGTMASPGVAVNQLNRSQHLDQLYYGVFKPAQTKRWVGNLKRYRLGLAGTSDAVMDATGANAIDPQTTFFSTNARSWWSAAVDGNNADQGGAASKQTTARTVYIDSGSAGLMTLLTPASPPAGMDADLVRWVQGIDVDDDNGNGSTTDARSTMGAPVHAQPTLVSYGAGNEDFVVFIGTNDGLLHSINVSDGTENWAWLPSDLKGIQTLLRSNPGVGASAKPQYGLDGNWTVVKTSSETLLVGGMRQGGSNIYAVKLPTTKTGAPTLKWVIKPSTSTSFSNLGYTWSQPVQTQVRVGGATKDVLVFGGGLDYDKYEAGGPAIVSTGGDKGRQLYMVEAATGNLVWMASSGLTTAGDRTNVPAMTYSVPGSPRVLDKNSDNLADHIYFADTGGQIFRVDLDNSSTAPKLVKRVAHLAKLGAAETASKANDRRFYETPAAIYAEDSSGEIYAAVAIGSGNRSFPKSDKAAQERFFVIRDYDAARFDILGAMTEAGAGGSGVPNLATVSGPFVTSSLADVTTTYGTAATTAVNAKKGWYINMGGAGRLGEKVLSSPFIFSRYNSATKSMVHEVNFNSFLPDSGVAAACSPVAGSTTSWAVGLGNGSAVRDLNGDGTLDRLKDGVATGITGSDVGLIRENAAGKLELKKLSGTSAETAGELPPGFGRILRTRWYDQQ